MVNDMNNNRQQPTQSQTTQSSSNPATYLVPTHGMAFSGNNSGNPSHMNHQQASQLQQMQLQQQRLQQMHQQQNLKPTQQYAQQTRNNQDQHVTQQQQSGQQQPNLPQQQYVQQQQRIQQHMQMQQLQHSQLSQQQQHPLQQRQHLPSQALQNSQQGQYQPKAQPQLRQTTMPQQLIQQQVQPLQQNVQSSSLQQQRLQQQYAPSQQYNPASQQMQHSQHMQQIFQQQPSIQPNYGQSQQQQNGKVYHLQGLQHMQQRQQQGQSQQHLHQTQQHLLHAQLGNESQNVQQGQQISKQHQPAMLQQQQHLMMQQKIMHQDMQQQRLQQTQLVDQMQQYRQQQMSHNAMPKLSMDSKTYSSKVFSPSIKNDYGTLLPKDDTSHVHSSLPGATNSAVSSSVFHGIQQTQFANCSSPTLASFSQSSQLTAHNQSSIFSQGKSNDQVATLQGRTHSPPFSSSTSCAATSAKSVYDEPRNKMRGLTQKGNRLQQNNNSGMAFVGFSALDSVSQSASSSNSLPSAMPLSQLNLAGNSFAFGQPNISKNPNHYSAQMLCANNHNIGGAGGNAFSFNMGTIVSSGGGMMNNSNSKDISNNNGYDTSNVISLGVTDGDAIPISVARLQQYLMKYLCGCSNARYSTDFVMRINKKFEDYKRELLTAAELKTFLRDSLGSELFKDLCADFRHKEGAATTNIRDSQNQNGVTVASNSMQLLNNKGLNQLCKFSPSIRDTYTVNMISDGGVGSIVGKAQSKTFKEDGQTATKKRKLGEKDENVAVRPNSKNKSSSSKKAFEKVKHENIVTKTKDGDDKKIDNEENGENSVMLNMKNDGVKVCTPTANKSIRNIISPTSTSLSRAKTARQQIPVSGSGKNISTSGKKKVSNEIKKSTASSIKGIGLDSSLNETLNQKEKVIMDGVTSVQSGVKLQNSLAASSACCQREVMCTWGRNYLDRKLWDFPAGIEVLELVEKGKLAAEFRKVEALVDRADYLAALRLQAAKRNILNFL